MMLKYNRVKPIRVPVHLKIPVPAPRPRPAFTLKISVPLLPRQGPSLRVQLMHTDMLLLKVTEERMVRIIMIIVLTKVAISRTYLYTANS